MSLYSKLIGENKEANTLLKVLNVDREFFGRYRDIYVNKDGRRIVVYTRLGGQNRPYYEDTFKQIRKHKLYLSDADDTYDNTYAYIYFKVPFIQYKNVTKFLADGTEPEDIKTKFDNAMEDLNNPMSRAYKATEEIAKQFDDAMKNDSKINIIEV